MNALRRNLLTIVLIFVLFPMMACQTAAPVPPAPPVPPVPDKQEPTFSIEEFSAPLGDKVVNTADSIIVKKVRIKKFTDGGIVADFTFYNNRGRRNVINYLVQWLDKNGMVVKPDDSWGTIALEGQQEMTISVISPSIDAVDYRLKLQTN